MELTAEEIDPLISQLRSDSPANVSAALKAIAWLELDIDTWRVVSDLTHAQLEKAENSEVLAASAHLPLTDVRARLRSIAADPQHLHAAAVKHELIEVRDEPILIAFRDELVSNRHWQPLMEMRAADLAGIHADHWGLDNLSSLFFVVCAGKAGHLELVTTAFQRAREGDLPQELAGDPMYQADLISKALPISSDFQQFIRNEAGEDPTKNNLVGCMVQGLLTEQVF